MKILKWIGWALLALLVVLVAIVAYVAATFDPNSYKPQLIQMVKERTGRTLTVDGDIELRFFPKIGAAVEGLALSAPNSDANFARIEEARVALALLPLLSKQIIVDEVTLTGLQADLVKYRDGRTNFDDLLGGEPEAEKKPAPKSDSEKAAQLPAIDIGGIALQNANVSWTDETNGTRLRASNINLMTGRIASGVPGKLDFSAHVAGEQPKLALQLALQAGYRFDLDKRAGQLSNLEFKAQGDAEAVGPLQLHVKGDIAGFDAAAQRIDLSGIEASAQSGKMLDAQFSITKLYISPERAESKPISGRLKYAQADRAVTADVRLSPVQAEGNVIRFEQAATDLQYKQSELAVEGKLATPVVIDLDEKLLSLARLAGEFSFAGPKVPNKRAQLALEGGQQLAWAKQTAQGELRAKLEDGTVNLKYAVRGFDAPAIEFDLAADRLNVDRYLPPGDEAQAAPAKGGAPSAGGGKADEAKEAPIDLAWLKPLKLRGSVKADALIVSKIQAQNVDIRVQADNGQLDVSPMRANLYGGSLAGKASVNAHRNAFAVQQRLTGVNIGPLLRDVADKDLLEGRGNVELDVRTAGATPDALKRALDGTASLVLKDGAVKGFNLAEALRKVKATLGSESAKEELARGGEQTDFSDLSASFRIDKGVARNDDLLLRSPFLRVQGAGTLDIPASSLDYSVKASLVNTSTGQGGKGLDQVASITVPVVIRGPLDALTYKLDTQALIADRAKEELRKQLERRLGGQRDAGEAQKQDEKKEEKPRGGLGEQLLRGLIK